MAFIGNTNTTQAFTPAVDYFSGNGSTTAFTLSRPVASVAQVQVVVNNVAQNPSSAYTVSSNTITFTSAPSSGTNNIYVYYTSPITQVIAPGQGTVNTTALGNITNIASGNSSLTLQTGSSNTTAVTIDTSQNVGIGTGSPATKLQTAINAANETTSALRLTNLNTNGYGIGIDFADELTSNRVAARIASITPSTSATGDLYFQTRTANTLTEKMRIDSSGNVGIGSSTITSADGAAGRIFKVSGSTNTVWVGETTGNGGYNAFIFEARNSNRSNPRFAQIQMQTTSTATDGGLIIFSTSATGSGTDISERMRIDSNGNVMVGTTSAIGSGKFSVSGQISAQQTYGPMYYSNENNTDNVGRGSFNFYRGGTLVGQITTTNSTCSYTNVSDYRLKENIGPMTGALEKVLRLKPCTYTWKSDGSSADGFIAHELQEVCPQAVHGTKDAVDADGNPVYQGVDTSFLVATLTAAIQEQQALITAQAETINALTARVAALENK